jgi:hypothetical protein
MFGVPAAFARLYLPPEERFRRPGPVRLGWKVNLVLGAVLYLPIPMGIFWAMAHDYSFTAAVVTALAAQGVVALGLVLAVVLINAIRDLRKQTR